MTSLQFRPPPNLNLKHNPLAKNPRPPAISPARPPLVVTPSDAAAAVGVDAAEVDAVASKPSRRPSLPPPRRALSPTCLGLKKARPTKEF
jgi:hypothetical protein